MWFNERADAVRRLLFDYMSSPSLRHIRDQRSIDRLTERIIEAIDREPSVWKKWEGQRADLIKAAAECWLPLEDLLAFLNELPGPRLTLTDVSQRLRAIHEEPYNSYPDHEIRDACLALYASEKAEGTEFPAIIGRLQEFAEEERARLRQAHQAAWAERREEERIALERRFLSGADCKWTPIEKSKDLYIRKNGRAFRLTPRKDKRWDLFRIESVEDRGSIIGTYGTRSDANKVIGKMAYEPEPRW